MSESTAAILVEQCSEDGIFIHSSLQVKSVPGAGLGVYSTKELKTGERIVHVPTQHIFTTANVPESFISTTAQKDIAVHALLAAYLAFGDADELRRYDAWVATWPALDDFVSGMPLFWGTWGEQLLKLVNNATPNLAGPGVRRSGAHEPKRRKVSNGGPISLSPAITGWTSLSPSPPGLLRNMLVKLAQHISSIAAAKPALDIINNTTNLTSFLYKWAIVNTRCFYYIRPKQGRSKAQRPSDPNEAMALIPFMDLFNHVAPPPSEPSFSASTNTNTTAPCKAKTSATGYEITTTSKMPLGAQVLLSYGAHSNDTLWLEYGFLLPGTTNTSDLLPLDDLVLDRLQGADKATLDDHGYLGSYTVYHDGSVCYRTEMVAWLLVLGRQKWAKVVKEGGDPEERCTSPTGKEKFNGFVRGWLERAKTCAEENMRALQELDTDEEGLLSAFGTVWFVRESQGDRDGVEVHSARQRRDMCLARWKQVVDMADRGIAKSKSEKG